MVIAYERFPKELSTVLILFLLYYWILHILYREEDQEQERYF